MKNRYQKSGRTLTALGLAGLLFLSGAALYVGIVRSGGGSGDFVLTEGPSTPVGKAGPRDGTETRNPHSPRPKDSEPGGAGAGNNGSTPTPPGMTPSNPGGIGPLPGHETGPGSPGIPPGKTDPSPGRSGIPGSAFAPGKALPGESSPFKVRVLSATDSEPVPEARVTLSLPNTGLFRGITRENGEAGFQLPARFKGRAVIVARGFRTASRNLASPGPFESRKVDVHLDVLKEEPFILRILDGTTGFPLPGVTLILSDGRFSSWDESGPDGSASLPLDLFRLPVHVDARREGYHPSKTLVRFRLKSKSLALRMYPASSLDLTFRSPAGVPVEAVEVTLHVSGDGWSGPRCHAASDETGRVCFKDFPLDSESRLAVRAAHESFVPFSRSLSLQEFLKNGGLFALELDPGVLVTGVVAVAGQQPGSALTVEFLFPEEAGGGGEVQPGQASIKTAPAGPDGAFELRGARSGDASVRVRLGSEVLGIAGVSIRRGTPLKIELPDPVPVTLTVRGAKGGFLPGARIYLLRRDGRFPPVRMEGATDSGGSFSFRTAFPGSLSGAIVAEGYKEYGFDLPLAGLDDVHLEFTLRRSE